MSGTRPASVREALEELDLLRLRRDVIELELIAARREIDRALVAARAAFPWLSLTELAAVAGVSRKTAHASLRRAAVREGE